MIKVANDVNDVRFVTLFILFVRDAIGAADLDGIQLCGRCGDFNLQVRA